MTTPTDEPGPAPTVPPADYIPTTEEAAQHRAHVAELHRQHLVAHEVVQTLTFQADTYHEAGVWLPALAESGDDVLDKDAWRFPCGTQSPGELQHALRTAARLVYEFAGHYGRVARKLTADLDAELRTTWVAYRVLTLDELGRLGYAKPSDEWVNDKGEPLGGWAQQVAHRLQQAGLLPDFDEFFATGSAEPEAGQP